MSDDVIRRQKDRAAQLLSKGRVPAALDEYRRILKAVPAELTVRQKVAELLARQGNTKEAVAEYSETVRRYAEQGQFFKATALCRVILNLDPKHDLAQRQLAELYAARDKKPGNLVVVKASATLDPDSIAPKPATAPPVLQRADEPVEIAMEDLIFEAEPPPPPRSALPSIPLFSSLDTDTFMVLLREAMEARVFAAGETILSEGAPGESMFALAQGTVSVQRAGREVAQMHEGDFFGEMALLTGAPRLATVVAANDVIALEFPRAAMESLINKHPSIKRGLDAFFRERLLANVLRANPLFSALDASQRAALSAAFESETFKTGSLILQEGQPGVGVFLLLRGSCRVFNDAGTSDYPDLVEGDAFGEISAVMQLPVTASVEATQDVVVLRISANDFRTIIGTNETVKKNVLRLASERMTRTAKQALHDDGDLRV
ncbi:MAG: cyclic nucleotide-binding domain-containing protein [Archangium sp.]